MSTIRRLYTYLLAFAGLATLSIACANLGQLLIVVLLGTPGTTGGSVRDAASMWGAAALVGLPVFVVHWLWAGRFARTDDRERSSTLRRLYLYGVLAGAALLGASSLDQTLQSAVLALAGSGTGEPAATAVLRPLPFALVASLVWVAHWRVASSDRFSVGEAGGSATLRRWYLYGLAFIGLVVMLDAGRAILETLWRLAIEPNASGGLSLAAPLAAVVVGLGLWLTHWVVLLVDADDRDSVLRRIYLFVALAITVGGSLLGASQLLYYALARLLGVAEPGGVGGNLLQAAAGPGSVMVVYGAVWTYQRHAIAASTAARLQEPVSASNSGASDWHEAVPRLYAYLVALIALGLLATGAGGLLWTLGNVLFAGQTVSAGGGWREQLALFATLAVVGLPVWLAHWGRRHEPHSLVRRVYLYITLIVAMLSLLGSAAAALYRLISLALGASGGVDVLVDLSHALAVAAVAAVLAAYQWRALRADSRTTLASTVSPAGENFLVVELRAADPAALQVGLAALRSSGVQVHILDGR